MRVQISQRGRSTVRLRFTLGLRGPKGDTGDASAPNSVTNAILADMPGATLKGRPAGAAGDPQDLTPVQARAVLAAPRFEAAANLGLILNPFMEISQEYGQSLAVLPEGVIYIIDGGMVGRPASFGMSAQQVSDPFSGVSGFQRFRRALRSTITAPKATLASSEYLIPYQTRLEGGFTRFLGWGTSDAQAIDVLAVVSVSVPGTYSISVRNGAADRSYVKTVTLPANTPTVILVTIPGDTGGTWEQSNAHAINFNLGRVYPAENAPQLDTWLAGNYTSHSTCVNWAATNGATFTVAYFNVFPTGVLPITAASQITGDALHALVNMRRAPDDELRRCQRYWSPLYLSDRFWATAAGQLSNSMFSLPAPMRANPTASPILAGTRSNLSAAPALNLFAGTSGRFEISSAAAGDTYALGDHWAFNARL